MKRLSGFIAGVLFTLVLSFIFVPSLAANLQTIEVGINSVNIVVDGKKISSIGEGYLRQGTEGEIAASLNYESSVYLPIRRISEILGVNVDYDSNTKTVLLTSNNYKLGKDTENIMPNTNILTEEEIQTAINKNATFITEINNYQDFKSVWTVVYDFQMSDGTYTNVAIFNQGVSKETFIALWSNIPYEDILKYSEKLVAEKQEISFKGQDLTLTFGWTDGILGTATCFSDGRTTSNFSNNTIN